LAEDIEAQPPAIQVVLYPDSQRLFKHLGAFFVKFVSPSQDRCATIAINMLYWRDSMGRYGILVAALLLGLAACSSDSNDTNTPGGAAGSGGGGSGAAGSGGSVTPTGNCVQPTKLLNFTDKAQEPDDTFRDIALDDTTLYATVEPGAGESPRIVRVPKAGGTPTEIVVGSTPYSLVVDADNLYWVSNYLYRMPKTGTTPEAITKYGSGSGPRKHSLAIDDTYLYFGTSRIKKTANNAPKAEVEKLVSESISANTIELVGDTVYALSKDTLFKFPKNGGTVTKLATDLDDDIAYFTVNSAWVVWVARSIVYKVSINGGDVIKVGGVSNIPTNYNGIACDTSFCYFVAGVNSFKMSLDGTGIQKHSCDGGYRLILDASNVYWIGYRDSEINVLPK